MRLTSDEIQYHKKNLSQWQSPEKFSFYVDKLMDKLGGEALFNQSSIGFVREAWVAGQFSGKRCAKAVRLITDHRPDFSLQFEMGEESYELIEADKDGRRRGDEYKEAQNAGQHLHHVPPEQWATAQQVDNALKLAVNRKTERAEKLEQQGTPYPPGTHLLIYLNIPTYGMHQIEIEDMFSQAVRPARKLFSSIWIFWKNRAYKV